MGQMPKGHSADDVGSDSKWLDRICSNFNNRSSNRHRRQTLGRRSTCMGCQRGHKPRARAELIGQVICGFDLVPCAGCWNAFLEAGNYENIS